MHNNYAFPFSASSTTTWRGPRVLPFQALQHSCHFSKGCSLHPLVYVYSGVPNLEMCFLLTLSESKSYHSHILFLNSCSTAFGQAYILHCDSWIQILPALSWNGIYTFHSCSVLCFSRGKWVEMGRDFLLMTSWNLKCTMLFFLLHSLEQIHVGFLCSLAFRVTLLQINTA